MVLFEILGCLALVPIICPVVLLFLCASSDHRSQGGARVVDVAYSGPLVHRGWVFAIAKLYRRAKGRGEEDWENVSAIPRESGNESQRESGRQYWNRSHAEDLAGAMDDFLRATKRNLEEMETELAAPFVQGLNRVIDRNRSAYKAQIQRMVKEGVRDVPSLEAALTLSLLGSTRLSIFLTCRPARTNAWLTTSSVV